MSNDGSHLRSRWWPWLVRPGFADVPSCVICRGPLTREESAHHCETCDLAGSTLGILTPVYPISLYCKPSALREVLTHYKPGRDAPVAAYGAILSDILRAFLDECSDGTWNVIGGWDSAVLVPSTRGQSPHALSTVARHAGLALDEDVIYSTGIPAVHRCYEKNVFRAAATVRGGRILLLDDVYVTGARAQTAATVLCEAGAHVIGVLVLGRRVNPSYCPKSAEFWLRHVEAQRRPRAVTYG
jgi:hypothetical protein